MKKHILLIFATLIPLLSYSTTVKTVTDLTAGGLKTILTPTERTTITDLTISGTIDARDFKTMRDNMPALESIDLSQSTIIQYIGTEGCKWASKSTYLANEIPERAFYDASTYEGKSTLRNFKFPTTTTAIRDNAFNNCYRLTGELVLPSTVILIGANAFEGCTGLSGTLTIPEGVTTIGTWAFSGCSGINGELILPKTLTTINEYAFNNCTGLTGQLEIPESLTNIENSTFYGCGNLTEIVLPRTLKVIGKSAFYGCIGLTGELVIPASVTKIEAEALQYCSALFVVDAESPNFSSKNGILLDKTGTTLLQYSYGIKGSCQFPDSVKTIGKGSFAFCTNLTAPLVLPNRITTIEDRAFYSCSELEGDLTIPESVKSIGAEAFFDCNKLTPSLTIPNSTISIGKSAFYSCARIRRIYSHLAKPIALKPNSNIFEGISKKNCKLYVLVGTKQAYTTTAQWKEFNNIIEFDPNNKPVEADNIAFSNEEETLVPNSDQYVEVIFMYNGISVNKKKTTEKKE